MRKHFRKFDMKNMTVDLPCSKAKGGFLRLVLTKLNWSGPKGFGGFPMRQCHVCGDLVPDTWYLTYADPSTDGSYTYFVDEWDSDAPCIRCQQRAGTAIDFPLHLDRNGRCRIRLVLRDGDGEEFNIWDPKAKKYGPLHKRGIRLMTGSNVLRLQPYDDRSGPAPQLPPPDPTPKQRKLKRGGKKEQMPVTTQQNIERGVACLNRQLRAYPQVQTPDKPTVVDPGEAIVCSECHLVILFPLHYDPLKDPKIRQHLIPGEQIPYGICPECGAPCYTSVAEMQEELGT